MAGIMNEQMNWGWQGVNATYFLRLAIEKSEGMIKRLIRLHTHTPQSPQQKIVMTGFGKRCKTGVSVSGGGRVPWSNS